MAQSRKAARFIFTRARFHSVTLLAAGSALIIFCASRAFCGPGPEAAAPDVQAKLGGSNTLDRLRAAEAVRDRAAAVPADSLRAALKAEQNPQVRYTLLQALAAQEGTAAVPDLAQALSSDGSSLVRAVAARTLMGIDAPEATMALGAALAGDSDRDVRCAAAASLSLHHRPEAVQALLKAAGHADPEIRKHAAFALTRQPKSRAIKKALDKLQLDPDGEVSARVKAWRNP